MKARLFVRPLLAIAALCTSLTALAGGAADSPAGNPVTRWNAVAIQVLPVDPGLVMDSRAFAIVHAAIHDAVNGVERRYQPYTIELSSPNASVDAAIATAARDTLVALSPSQSTTVQIAYAATLLGIPDGAAKQAGIELGRRSAEANLARRVGDGADSAGGPPYVPKVSPATMTSHRRSISRRSDRSRCFLVGGLSPPLAWRRWTIACQDRWR